MALVAWLLVALSLRAANSFARPLRATSSPTEPDPSFFVNVQLGGNTYTNKVLY